MDYYEVLCVGRDASRADIKRAYRECAAASHPDREHGSVERMAAVNAAWACLGDTERRAAYDLHGEEKPPNRIKDQAREFVAETFQGLLLVQGVANIVSAARDRVLGMTGQAKQQRENVKEARAKLALLRGAVRYTGEGDNMMHALCDQKERELSLADERAGELLEVLEAAFELLLAYEYEQPPTAASAPPVGFYTITQSTFTSTF